MPCYNLSIVWHIILKLAVFVAFSDFQRFVQNNNVAYANSSLFFASREFKPIQKFFSNMWASAI